MRADHCVWPAGIPALIRDLESRRNQGALHGVHRPQIRHRNRVLERHQARTGKERHQQRAVVLRLCGRFAIHDGVPHSDMCQYKTRPLHDPFMHLIAGGETVFFDRWG